MLDRDTFDDWCSDYIGSEVNDWIDDNEMHHHSQHELDTWSDDDLESSYNQRGCAVEAEIVSGVERMLKELNLLE